MRYKTKESDVCLSKNNPPYKITFKTEPSKTKNTEQDYKDALNKSISLIIDELILEGKIKIG